MPHIWQRITYILLLRMMIIKCLYGYLEPWSGMTICYWLRKWRVNVFCVYCIVSHLWAWLFKSLHAGNFDNSSTIYFSSGVSWWHMIWPCLWTTSISSADTSRVTGRVTVDVAELSWSLGVSLRLFTLDGSSIVGLELI